jgi:hypothetical protein
MKRILFAALVAGACAAHAQRPGDLKGFSNEEVDQYLSGAGMGYAKAAELNHFPGPLHVLELGERLGLSGEQRAATKQLMDAHKAEARTIGAKLVEAERALEQLFSKESVDRTTLAEAVRKASALHGEYRLSHLETHRRMRALLTEEQVKRYDELRGYSRERPAHPHRH